MGRYMGAMRRQSDAVKEWGQDGADRIHRWLELARARYGTATIVALCRGEVTAGSLENLRGGTTPSPRLAKAVAEGLSAAGIVVDLDAIARGRAAQWQSIFGRWCLDD